MIACYLDASALVKRYIDEPGSELVGEATADAKAVATSMISQVEVVAALAKAIRVGVLTTQDAGVARQEFAAEWPDLQRLQITESMMDRAGDIAWEQGLRGYDAAHLAAAVTWKEALGEDVTMTTFDRQLWHAAHNVGLGQFPDDLPALLESWKSSPETSPPGSKPEGRRGIVPQERAPRQEETPDEGH